MVACILAGSEVSATVSNTQFFALAAATAIPTVTLAPATESVSVPTEADGIVVDGQKICFTASNLVQSGPSTITGKMNVCTPYDVILTAGTPAVAPVLETGPVPVMETAEIVPTPVEVPVEVPVQAPVQVPVQTHVQAPTPMTNANGTVQMVCMPLYAMPNQPTFQYGFYPQAPVAPVAQNTESAEIAKLTKRITQSDSKMKMIKTLLVALNSSMEKNQQAVSEVLAQCDEITSTSTITETAEFIAPKSASVTEIKATGNALLDQMRANQKSTKTSSLLTGNRSFTSRSQFKI